MKKLLFLAIAIATLIGCDKGGGSQNSQGGTMTFKRADISGAKFLTLASSGDAQTGTKTATETSRLYKIDENGNMTTVVFYIEIDIDGNKTTEQSTEDIKVTPERIIDYGKEYMLFDDCRIDYITDKYMHFYNGQSSRNFLVKKSDGAIFELTYDQRNSFPETLSGRFDDFISNMQITYNSRGELYMVGRWQTQSESVSKLKLENEKLLLQQLTTGIKAYKILMDKSDNLYVSINHGDTDNILQTGGNIYSANGSVVAIPADYGHAVLLIDNEYYILDIEPIHQGGYDYIYNHKLSKISSYTPSLGFEEMAEITIERSLDQYATIAIDAGNRVLFVTQRFENSCLVYDKSAKKLSSLPLSGGFDKVKYNLQGVAYEFSIQNCTQITKYNIIDMTKQTINCDRGAVPPFIQTATQQNSTDFFEFGIKNSDGSPIRVQTNLETGKVVVYEDKDDRKVTELIKVS